jgi:PIN domain nuclease of toxin-antitoxin system
MAEAVLDSSAVLGVLWREPGFEEVADVLARSLISVVNDAEVISVLMQRGDTAERALSIVHALPYEVVALDVQLARRAGALWRVFKTRGLSLADRCCLALAEREGLPVLTSDQRWADLSIGVEVRLFRPGKGT